jgi:ATP-binding cassette subfamily F protein uup
MTVLLSVQGLTKAYGPRPLFADLSLDLRAGDRVGLIGPNGSGKSTLLKLLAGREEADAGTRSLRRTARIGLVSQQDVFPPGQTVRQIVLAALGNDPAEEHERATLAAIALTQAGFDDLDRPANVLSGGWRKRLALARELARQPDLLLLDEPTNHLDVPGIVWLERLLRGASFGYVVATHDRAFLRAVADEIIEINRAYPGGCFRAAGAYDEFVDRREEFLDAQAQRQESIANQVRRETEWLSRKESAQRRKSVARIEEAARRQAELAELKERNAAAEAAGIDFVATGRQTRKLLTATGIAKAAGGRLFADLDLALVPGRKVGLVGPNGSGKSTLLRVLAGSILPDAGSIKRAEGLRPVLFEQGREALDPTTPLRKALCPNGDTVVYRERRLHVVAWAKQFLFRPEQLDVPVGDLSGGEQARVRIAQLMLQPADLLLLDEPTNDLDIPALEVLEESLAEFAGAVVLVSHDRDLMDRLCTEVVGLDGCGGAGVYGSIGQWLAAYERALAQQEKPTAKPAPPAARSAAEGKPRKLSYHEQREWAGIEAAITAAEAVVLERQTAVERAATAGHAALAEACRQLEEAQRAVERLYARWQELEAKREP